MNNLLLDEYPLVVLPSLATAIGLNEAILLQQINYWIQKKPHTHDGRPWIYNSVPKWREQFPFWSESTIRRTINSLKKQDLIVTTNKYNKMPMDNTMWYSINRDILNRMTRPSSQNDQTSSQNEQTMLSEWTDEVVNVNRAIPETTTETNSDSVVGEAVSNDLNIYKHYEKTWGIAPNASLLSMKKYQDLGFEDALIIECMEIAVKKGKRWTYAAGILDNLEHQHNVFTLEAYKALSQPPRTRSTESGTPTKNSKADFFNELAASLKEDHENDE